MCSCHYAAYSFNLKNLKQPNNPATVAFERYQMASSSFIFRALTALLLLLVIVHLSLDYARNDVTPDPFRCRAAENAGRWLFDNPPRVGGSHWQPVGCMLHDYTSGEIEQCFDNQQMVFIGDSTVRQIFWATARTLNMTKARGQISSASKHANLRFMQGSSKLTFIWDPYLNSSDYKWLWASLHQSAQSNGSLTAWAVIGGGLWHAHHLGERYLRHFENDITRLISAIPPQIDFANSSTVMSSLGLQHVRPEIVFIPVIIPDPRKLDSTRSMTLTAKRILPMNSYLQTRTDKIRLLHSLTIMSETHPSALQDDGFHLSNDVALAQSNLMLNLHCNDQPQFQHYPFDKDCCSTGSQFNFVQVILLGVTFMLLFSSTVFSITWNDTPNTVPSRFRNHLFTEVAVVFGACSICFVDDRHPIFASKQYKTVNEPLFALVVSMALLAGIFLGNSRRSKASIVHLGEVSDSAASMHPVTATKSILDLSEKSQTTDFLPRHQTEEWKGWMQLLILLYHYFGMSKVLWVYQLIRLLVASYLFLTGFGHTIFLLNTNDFTFRRVAAVLVRLNLLSILLSFMMTTDYNFYYFPALSSFWFLVVYFTLMPGMPQGRTATFRWMLGRCLISVVLVRILIETPRILETLCSMLSTCFNMKIEAREFRFRVSLDRYIVYFGMMLGWAHHHASDGTIDLKCLILLKPVRHTTYCALLVAIAALVLIIFFWMARIFTNKFDYNEWHPLISFIPVLAYVVLRNASQKQRQHYSPVFAWLGRCSLETFILQYHMWLAADTKGVLRLKVFGSATVTLTDGLTGWSAWVEFAVVTAFFLWTSWLVSLATGALTTAFIGSKELGRDNTAGERAIFWKTTRQYQQSLAARFAIAAVLLVVANWLF